MNTNLETISTPNLRTKYKIAEPGSDEHEAIRAELARRVAEIKARLNITNDCIRIAMNTDAAPHVEEYYRALRDELSAELDRALGF